jgi:formylglycine-generating enzyme required for sulfatase activity
MHSLLSRGVALIALSLFASVSHADDAAIRKAVTFYASFDESPKADVGGGELTLRTRFNDEKEKGKFVFENKFDDKVFRVAKGKGVAGGALEATDVLPRNGRVFYPLKGNIAFKKDGWDGALSCWINTDPNKLLKTKFCDPIQITEKGANNGGIWFDFNDAKPRDMRHGAFTAVKEGEKAIPEEDPKAPMVRMKDIGFKSGDWHHIVLSWKNFDTGKPNAVSALYVDGKLIGEVKDRAIGMDWDLDKAGLYTAVNYIGLLDELALFNRALTAVEVASLHKTPGLLAALKKKDGNKEEGRIESLRRAVVVEANGPRPVAPKFPFNATTARQYQADYAKALSLPVEVRNGLGMEFVLVPPGTFRMGSPDDEPGHNLSGYAESPLHTVTLTQPFYLGKHEVTVGQFRRFVEATNHKTDGEKNDGGNAHDAKAEWKHRAGTNWKKPGYAGEYKQDDRHPVVHVSHADALAFSKWLNDGNGDARVQYGLPTEAQWEWACRAGAATRYWWGADEDKTGKVANVGDKSLKKMHAEWPRTIMDMDDGHAFVAPVGSYRPNAFGLHDMLGNVWEFCSTRYGPYPKEPVTDPTAGDPKRGFAVRGGGWSNVANDARCASRNADPPHFCHSNLGFRVAVTIPARKK